MSNLKSKFDFVLKLFILLSVLSLFLGFYYLHNRLSSISGDFEKLEIDKQQENLVDIKVSSQEMGDFYTKDEVERLISRAIATISGIKTEAIVEKQTVITETIGTTYIPMGITATTTNTSWVDVEDSQVFIDVKNDYGESATVSWEASLKVAHGNGQAFARLYDDTNKIAVDGSEISTTNNASFERASSGNLPFWRGRNLYKVQIKSLNSFEVTYSGGKIKVGY